jgi:molybdopterin synthase sulfur carrier subunit
MIIKSYAVLKDYFSTEEEINVKVNTIGELKKHLCALNPLAQAILDISRFAVDDTFVELDYKLNGTELVSIVPPSSGG